MLCLPNTRIDLAELNETLIIMMLNCITGNVIVQRISDNEMERHYLLSWVQKGAKERKGFIREWRGG